jgi:hypothetical protein
VYALLSCAQQASPQGGPRDQAAPVIAKTTPATGTLFFKDNAVTIYFSEVIRKPTFDKEIFISPLIKRPDLSLSDNGKRLTIKFDEELRPQTTYIISLNDIQDANEGNKLAETYLLAFSTGSQLDSAQLRGRIFLPALAQGAKEMSVLLFDPDSIVENEFLLKRPAYLTKTNDQGEFSFRYLRQAGYRILAVKDEDQSNSYSLGSEQVAITLDSLIVPTEQIAAAIPVDSLSTDSLLTDSLSTDSLSREEAAIPPDSVAIFTPSDSLARDSLASDTAGVGVPESGDDLIKLLAFVPDQQAPTLRGYNFLAERTLALKLSEWPRLDSLTAWLTDTTGGDSAPVAALTVYRAGEELRLLVGLDREAPFQLHLQQLSDSLGNALDTVLAVKPERLVKQERPVLLPPQLRPDLKAWRVLLPQVLDDEAVKSLVQVSDTSRYDSLRQSFAFESSFDGFYLLIRPQSLSDLTAPYVLSVAGAAGIPDTALRDSQFRFQLTWLDPEDYGTLSGRVQLDSSYRGGLVLELRNGKNELVRTAYDTTFRFVQLLAGEYQFRVILDEDRNQTYTPGKLTPPRWPERTYVVPEKVTIRGNWDFADHLIQVPTTDQSAAQRQPPPPPQELPPDGENGGNGGNGGPPGGIRKKP